MAKTKKLSELDIEQLHKNEKKIKTILYLQITAIVILTILGVYITISKGFGVFTVFPVFFIPTIFPIWYLLSETKKEIKLREN